VRNSSLSSVRPSLTSSIHPSFFLPSSPEVQLGSWFTTG
jgi:hypothetical protein